MLNPHLCIAIQERSSGHRLRTANILLINMKALSNEIAKNLVLAGIGSLTIQDDQAVAEDDLGAEFFISEQSIGLNVSAVACLEFQVLIVNTACRSISASDQKAQPEGFTAC